MQKKTEHLDAYFILLLLDLFIVTMVLFWNKQGVDIFEYILLASIIFTAIISYLKGIVWGLLLSAVSIFGLGTYLIYMSMIQQINVSYKSYMWIVAMPVTAYLSGRISMILKEAYSELEILKNQVEELVTIDRTTGMTNIKGFYGDLHKEMSKSKRHKFNLTVMVVKMQYYGEVLNLVGETKIEEIMKGISRIIEESTRNEDEKYRIYRDTFTVIMPNTDEEGAEIVKNRVKERIKLISIDEEEKKQKYKLDFKVGILQYRDNIESTFEYKELLERELEFDV